MHALRPRARVICCRHCRTCMYTDEELQRHTPMRRNAKRRPTARPPVRLYVRPRTPTTQLPVRPPARKHAHLPTRKPARTHARTHARARARARTQTRCRRTHNSRRRAVQSLLPGSHSQDLGRPAPVHTRACALACLLTVAPNHGEWLWSMRHATGERVVSADRVRPRSDSSSVSQHDSSSSEPSEPHCLEVVSSVGSRSASELLSSPPSE